MDSQEDLSIENVAGRSIVNKHPIFSNDSKLLFIVYGNSVRAYSTITGELVRVYGELDHPIVSAVVNPLEDSSIVACSVKGQVVIWDQNIGVTKIKQQLKIDENTTIKDFFVVNSKTAYFDILILAQKKKKVRVEIYSMKDGSCVRSFDTKVQMKNYLCSVGGESGSERLYIVQDKWMHVCDLYGGRSIVKFLISNRIFTSVCGHPRDLCVATGDDSGRVLVWRNFYSGRGVAQAVYHWHTLPALSLAWTSAGTHLYSGGSECVLVKWTLDSTKSCSFLPRLPASLLNLAVSPDNSSIAVVTQDNGIQIVDSDRNQIRCVIQHMSWCISDVPGMTLFPVGLVYDFRTRALVLNSRIGHIQFHSTHTNSLLYNLDITGQNKLTQERGQTIINTTIVCVALNSEGLWMATVEERNDPEVSLEVRLKFWNYDEKSQSWSLNTFVNRPHDGAVTAARFRPKSAIETDEEMCVTIGCDKRFRLWRLEDTTTIYKKNKSWLCVALGYYRDAPCSTAAFHSDGSVLGVTFGPTVTVWLPDSCELKCSLVYSPHGDRPLRHLVFGSTDQTGHLIVAATDVRITVWNLLSLRIMWTVAVDVFGIYADPISPYVAIFTKNNVLFVFTPLSSKPVYTRKDVCGAHSEDTVLAAAFVPHFTDQSEAPEWQRSSQLYFMTSKQELLCLKRHSASDDETLLLESIMKPRTAPTPYQTLITDRRVIKSVEHVNTGLSDALSVTEFIKRSTHTTEPMASLCEAVLRSFLQEANECIRGRYKDNKNEEEHDKEKSIFEMLRRLEVDGDESSSDDSEDDTFTEKQSLPMPPAPVPDIDSGLQRRLDELLTIPMEWMTELSSGDVRVIV